MTNQDKTTTEPTQPSPDGRAADFKPVEGAPAEQYSGGALLVEAYAAIWLIIIAWLFFMWRKQSSLSARLDGLEAAIDRAEAAKSKKA
jgi:CcmD family protein